jgi:predicted thioesterase
MKSKLAIGTVGVQRFVVTADHVIDFATDGMPAVLCTPSLIWFLEHAARAAVVPCLEPGESTVGIEIELQHLAPTPLGSSVTCQARVVRVEGPEISFQLEAQDEQEPVGKGFHKLRVIRVDRFAARVGKKAS